MAPTPKIAVADSENINNLEQRIKKDASSTSAADYSVQVHGWPTCRHNIAWSDDAELAVGLDDHIELLIPRVSFAELKELLSPAVLMAEPAHDDDRRLGRRNTKAAVEGLAKTVKFGARSGAGSSGAVERPGSTENGRWKRFSIVVNMFKEAEMPMLEPLPFEDMSVGEEQSLSHVLGLAWSAPGLAWNHGAVLAVLTANGAVGIWDAVDGKRDMVKEWKRAATVNQALRKWAKTLLVDDGKPREQWLKREWDTRQRMRARLRSFAWIPVLKKSKGKQMIAVSNDLGEILIFEISRPRKQSRGFRVEYRAQMDVRKPVASSIAFGSFEAFAGPPRCAKNLTCSEVLVEPNTDRQCSVLAYTIGTQLYWACCFYKTPEEMSQIEFSAKVGRAEGEHIGPLKWHYMEPRRDPQIISFNRREIIATKLEIFKESYNHKATQVSQQHGLGWDPVAGCTVTSRHNINVLHCSPHMVYSNTSLPSRSLQSTPSEAQNKWSQVLQQRRDGFAAEFNMGTDVVCRMWGLTTAPTARQVAMCISLHPTKMLQYQMSAYQHSHVLISDEEQDLPTHNETSGRQLSTEAILFGFSRWLRQRAANKSLDAESITDLERFLDASIVDAEALSSIVDDSQINSAAQRLLAAADRREWLKPHLAQIISTIQSGVGTRSTDIVRPEPAIRDKYCKAVLDLPSGTFRSTPLGSRILHFHSTAVTHLRESTREDAMELDPKIRLPSTDPETCNMCDADIYLQSLDWAKCSGGHTFGRCNMTFLAIQEPGITTRCALCEKRYLSPSYLLVRDRDVASSSEAQNNPATGSEQLSLVELLVAVFKQCLYCGGKLVG